MNIQISENQLNDLVEISAKWISNYREIFKCSLKHTPHIGVDKNCQCCKDLKRLSEIVNSISKDSH